MGAESPTAPLLAGRPTPRSRLAERGVDRTLLLLIPAIGMLLALFAYPFVYGLTISLQPQEGSGALANYRGFFSDAFQRDTILTTLKLALPATAVNVTGAIPIAYRLRGPFRGKRLLTTILVVPVTLGTVLVAEGLLRYLGPRGWLNRLLSGDRSDRRAAATRPQLLGRPLLAGDHRLFRSASC